jgi:hypothetical protein
MPDVGPGGPKGRGRKIVVISYDEDTAEREEVDDLGQAFERIGRRKVTWIVIKGRLEGRDMTVVRDRLGLHPVMMDELYEELPGRPRLIDYKELIFVSWKLLELSGQVVQEKKAVSLLGKGFLLTLGPADRDYRETFDTGAGDTVIATLSLSRAGGRSEDARREDVYGVIRRRKSSAELGLRFGSLASAERTSASISCGTPR